MNIFIISVIFPYPIDNGGSVGTFQVIEYLRKSHDITFLCPESTPENFNNLQKLWPNVDLQCFSQAKNHFSENRIKKVIKSLLPKVALTKEQIFRKSMVLDCTDLVNFYFEDLIKKTQFICNNKKLDIIQVEFIDMAPIIHFLPLNVPKVFVHHEIRYKRMMLEYNTLEHGSEADLWKICNTETLEIALLKKYDKVICLSQPDKEYLSADGIDINKIEVSPLPVYFPDHKLNIPFNFQNRLIFLGPEEHFPNLDAVNWFLENAWQPLKKSFPELRFEVIGKWSEKSKKGFSNFKDVDFCGYVENLESKMEGSIMVVPLRIGSGMRMKILEGISWHVPVVSTNIGAEGLPMKDNHNVFLADSTAEFVEKLSTLISNSEIQNNFISVSKNIIQENYGLEMCGKRREKILEESLAVSKV